MYLSVQYITVAAKEQNLRKHASYQDPNANQFETLWEINGPEWKYYLLHIPQNCEVDPQFYWLNKFNKVVIIFHFFTYLYACSCTICSKQLIFQKQKNNLTKWFPRTKTLSWFNLATSYSNFVLEKS